MVRKKNLNTLLVPFLKAAMQLAVDGVAEPKMVDKTWMISTGAPICPFAFLDIIGPNTPYNLYRTWGDQGDELSAKVVWKYMVGGDEVMCDIISKISAYIIKEKI